MVEGRARAGPVVEEGALAPVSKPRVGEPISGRGRGHRRHRDRRDRRRPHLVAAHSSFVSERCAEVSLHVRYGERSRAVAARFELIRDRWQVSALEFA